MATYFTYEAKEYESYRNVGGSEGISSYGLPSVQVMVFKLQQLHFYLHLDLSAR